MIKRLESLFGALKGMKILRPVRTIIETMEGITLGSADTAPGAPHIRDHIEIKRYMSMVIVALMPSTLSSVYFYGWHAVWMIITSYVAGGIVEVTFALIRKKEIEEGFLVTGLIFPLILPPTTPLWVVAVGIATGTFFGKEVFGGTGRNTFNPALVGRLFITVAFPGIMSAAWKAPFADAITTATPLSIFKGTQVVTPVMDLLLGQTAGSMGELFRIGIIAGGIFLIITWVSSWRISITYLVTVLVLALAGNRIAPDLIAPPVFQILAGGLLFGAFFMATDPVTSPATRKSKGIRASGWSTPTSTGPTLPTWWRPTTFRER